jgi:biotin carboxyl carrier protein
MKNFKFKIRGTQYNVDIQDINKNEVEIEVNGTPYLVTIEREVKPSKTPTIVRKRLPNDVKKPKLSGDSLKSIKAPLPGNIFKINIKEGDSVKKGETLLIMEAMKMENNILAEFDGVVKSVKVKEGDTVLQNDILIELN